MPDAVKLSDRLLTIVELARLWRRPPHRPAPQRGSQVLAGAGRSLAQLVVGQMGFGAHGHESGGEERANACRIRWGDLRPERSARGQQVAGCRGQAAAKPGTSTAWIHLNRY